MPIIEITLSYDTVRILGTLIARPPSISSVQWIEFWQNADWGYDAGLEDGYEKGWEAACEAGKT